MSVAGIDVGNCTSCVALARKRGVDVIMNSESKRETPAVVSYGDKMRFIGVDGAARLMMNVKNTVVEVKRLIGRRFADPAVQRDIAGFFFKVTEAPDGGCLINVLYQGEPRTLTPEQVMTSLLKDVKGIAERDQGSAITDCVLSVPVYFTEAERRAMLAAASLAGLKCLRLMNEPTAAALNFGIFKSDLPEDEPMNVVFVDVGHSSLQVSIAAFKKGAMEIKAHAWDRALGGRDLDAALVAHFAAEFKASTGLDVYESAKARFRLFTQAEKCRQILTINPQAPISVECLMNDMDFRSEITRDKLEELAAPVLERAKAPCLEALRASGLEISALAGVEMVGAASRTPAIVRTVAEVFQQEPRRTMNSKECVSRGCALQAAMLSPIFQVRHFDVKDLFPFKINLEWEKADGPASSTLFGAVERLDGPVPQHLPSIKGVNFAKIEPFALAASYDEGCDIGGAGRKIADVRITSSSQAPPEATSEMCHVSFELDLHGLLRCIGATHNHKLRDEAAAAAASKGDAVAATPPAADGTAAAGDAAADGAPGGENVAPNDGDAAAPSGGAMETDAPPAASKPEPKVKTKKVSRQGTFEQISTCSLSTAQYNALLEAEGEMAASDALQTATDEAKNSLEEYVYGLRGKVQGDCYDFVADAERDALVSELNAMEEWLYEEGEDEKKSVYEAKLKELRGRGDAILLRASEAGTREPAMQALSNRCQHNIEWCGTTDAKYAHLGEADREVVRSESVAVLKWLEGVQKAQAALGKTDPPAVLTADLEARLVALDKTCRAVIERPAPPPPKPAEPEPEASKDEGAAEPMDADAPAGTDGADGAAGAAANCAAGAEAGESAAAADPDTAMAE